MARTKKRGIELFQDEDLGKFFQFVKKNISLLKKNLGRFEEPYSEVSQDYKKIMIKITLPDIKKRKLQLKMSDSLVEVKAETPARKGRSSFKTFYRAIPLPSNAVTQKAVAKYKKNTLKIVIPKLND